ncbi:MAG TPA: hypothetical protein VFE47_07600 [Tepidisphaeraceae bacterium]|jgi:hypothetical protein|nr:hypothetical protein [Tepidisphaeraceae bacterium]
MRNEASSQFERQCREHFDRYFDHYPNGVMDKRAMKTLRFVMADEEARAGKPGGWAAGIIYFLANQDRQACGVPGLLNSELEEFFGVSISTVRKRAAWIHLAVEI